LHVDQVAHLAKEIDKLKLAGAVEAKARVEEVEELKQSHHLLQKRVVLLTLLSPTSYAGISKEAEFADGFDVMALLEKVDKKIVEVLWSDVKDLRSTLVSYGSMHFTSATEREPWLQKNVFIPLLQVLKNSTSKYRLHGNNVRLHHAHNSKYSMPDAMLTRVDQFSVDPNVGGPVFELEHTIAENNTFDKLDHYQNGQGQIVMYLVTEALGTEGRKLFLGFLTDCRNLVCYQLDASLQFHRSHSMELLADREDPTTGFRVLVSLFHTDPKDIQLPASTTSLDEIEGFDGLTHTVVVKGKPSAELVFTSTLGLGASSYAFEGDFTLLKKTQEIHRGVCIKIGYELSEASDEGERQKCSQVKTEIRILKELGKLDIAGIPTLLWSRYAPSVTSDVLRSIVVVREVGVLLHGRAELQTVYNQVKQTLIDVHEKGYFHHDVSPSNIILVGKGSSVQPILIDWGLANKRGEVSVGFSGNPMYSSVAYDAWHGPGYKYVASDDLESLVYSVCAVHHTLGWANCKADAARKDKKMRANAATICGALSWLEDDLRSYRLRDEV
jgi:hypothetical protein